ncbi:WG repeat-containing protein [bacterium]|nr:WG repeat-containing protein [bacterium]MBP9807094.1 WG repeat-containing protein [bacterium]
MFKLRLLSIILALGFFNSDGASAFTDGGPGFLPAETSGNESKEGRALSAEEVDLATHKQMLKDWLAGYEKFKINQPVVMQYAALVKIADVQYQLGNLTEAESLYKEASDATEADLGSLANKAVSNHDVSICALNSYACFLAEKGQIAKASELMRLIYKLLKQPTSYSFNVGFGGNDEFGTFLAIVKNKDTKTYREFYPQWKAYKATVVPMVLPKVSGFKIDVPDVEQMSDFVDDKAVARDSLTCRYGYVNKTGKWVIKPTFIAANPFSEGVATAKISSGILPIEVEGNYDKFSLIDSSGRELKKLPAFHISHFHGPFCFEEHHARGPSSYIFDHSGDILYSGHFRVRSQRSDGLTIFEVTGQTRSGCIVDEVGHDIKLELKPDVARPGHYKLIPISVAPESQAR